MPTQAFDLLSTKLTRPPVTTDWVDRSRLIMRLNRSLQEGSLTLVCASAGFGKTTLVSSWIVSLTASRPPSMPAAWLSLDEGDNDPVVFLRYFVAAIRSAFPESCAETRSLLQNPQTVSQMPLVIALTQDIDRLPARCVLVLDDYHTVHDERVHDLLGALLRHWPPKLHLVLITRSNPPLPLSKLRAGGQVGEIRTHDLRFRANESAEFLSKVLRAPLSESTLAMLEERLEGWIAGLRLVTMSLDAGASVEQDLAALSGSHFEITDYLADEVISSQPADILRFLLTTSILDRFCAPLCESLLNSDASRDSPSCDVQACMQWLERHNLFVVPLDDHRQWYRYHHLFQGLLQRRLLHDVSPEHVTGLHRRAAAWLEGQGLIDEAIRHALAIDDLARGAQLMVAGFCDVLNREDRATCERWLRLLPEDFIQHHPWLLLMRSVTYQWAWQLGAQWKTLDQVEALLDEGAREGAPDTAAPGNLPLLRGILAAFRAQQASACNQPERAVACGAQALAVLPKEWRIVRGGAIMYWSMGMRSLGQGEVAQRTLMDEWESSHEKHDVYVQFVLFAACFNAVESGNLEQAERFGQAMLDVTMSAGMPITSGHARYALGLVHYSRNELDAAEQHFRELTARRFAMHAQTARNGMMGLMRVHMARADWAAVGPIMELLSQFDSDRLGQEGEDARSLRAQLEYLHGDTEPAFRWVDGFKAPVVVRSLLWLQNPHLAKAQILLERGTDADVRSALDILDALLEIAERTFSNRSQIEVLSLRALALDRQGKTADGLAALQKAVELARPGGFVRVFVDLGSPMRTMLLRLAGRGFAVETIRRIVAAFPELPKQGETSYPGSSEMRAANAGLVEPLSSRELEVLALLRERLSNQEIAKQLRISTQTVKRHTVNLYGKLGVSSRRDAVVKAESLKILPPP